VIEAARTHPKDERARNTRENKRKDYKRTFSPSFLWRSGGKTQNERGAKKKRSGEGR
jgi:hypothetical protein